MAFWIPWGVIFSQKRNRSEEEKGLEYSGDPSAVHHVKKARIQISIGNNRSYQLCYSN